MKLRRACHAPPFSRCQTPALLDRWHRTAAAAERRLRQKASEVERLNRELGGEDGAAARTRIWGPMEATIKNATREIAAKEKASKELQRRWVGYVDGRWSPPSTRTTSSRRRRRGSRRRTVLVARRARLEKNRQRQAEEIKALAASDG